MKHYSIIEKKVNLGKGIAVFYQTMGNGTPLVFVHGWGYPWKIIPDFILVLAAKYQLIFLNLPGYYLSDIGNNKGSIQEYAQVLDLFLDKVKMSQNAVLIGHSMGAVVVLQYLKNHPEKRIKSILIGLPLKDNIPLWMKAPLSLRLDRLVARTAIAGKLVNYAAQKAQSLSSNKTDRVKYSGQVNKKILMKNLASLLALNKHKIYRSLSDKPVLIYGEHDLLKKECRKGSIKYHEVSGAGHSPILDKPKETAELILQILGEAYE